MADYLPKSKYSIKYTNGGLLATIHDNVEYIGKYIQTSNNQYIAGTKLSGEGLILLELPTTNIDRNPTALTYTSSNKGKDIYNDLKGKRNVPSSKPQPTEKDYKRGNFRRFYIFKNNEPDIIYETSNAYLDEYKEKIDSNLYTVDSILWGLKGRKSVFENESTIKVLQAINPFIHSLFSEVEEYVEIDDENHFQKQIDPNQMLDEIPTFTLKQWNMFNSLDKEKLIIKYGEVNITDL